MFDKIMSTNLDTIIKNDPDLKFGMKNQQNKSVIAVLEYVVKKKKAAQLVFVSSIRINQQKHPSGFQAHMCSSSHSASRLTHIRDWAPSAYTSCFGAPVFLKLNMNRCFCSGGQG